MRVDAAVRNLGRAAVAATWVKADWTRSLYLGPVITVSNVDLGQTFVINRENSSRAIICFNPRSSITIRFETLGGRNIPWSQRGYLRRSQCCGRGSGARTFPRLLPTPGVRRGGEPHGADRPRQRRRTTDQEERPEPPDQGAGET